MHRREFASSLALIAVAATSRAASIRAPGPPFWLARRGRARVFLLGFGGAKDDSWLTPPIRRAMLESSQLWLEVGPGRISDQLLDELGLESGRTFFDALQPAVRPRAQAYVEQLDIDRAAIEKQRPWRAFYSLNSAFWSHHPPLYEEV